MEPSLSLLVACCRHNLGSAEPDLPRRLRQADGERLAMLARRHGLEQLAWRTLRKFQIVIPGTAALGMEARAQADDARRLARESGRIHRQFAGASLPHLFLGGSALAGMAWHNSLLARTGQIRLLVTQAAVGKAAALLSFLGYVQEEPDPSVDTTDWHRRAMRSCWRSDDGVLLHLHTRLAEHPAVLAGLAATTSPALVEVVEGVALSTFPPALQLALLATEGCAAAWSQLALLAEFAALVRRLGPDALAPAVDRSANLGAERSVAAALVLSHQLLGTALPPELWFDAGAARLLKLGRAEIEHSEEPKRGRSGGWRAAYSRMLLLPGSRFLIGDALRQLGSALTR
jgi:hypothetical protein